MEKRIYLDVRRKSYSIKDLAILFKVSTKTITKWLRKFKAEIGEMVGKLYCHKQADIIFDKLGEPGWWVDKYGNKIELRPYTIKELAGIYNRCTRTITRWIEIIAHKIGPLIGRFFYINQVELIFDTFGSPE